MCISVWENRGRALAHDKMENTIDENRIDKTKKNVKMA